MKIAYLILAHSHPNHLGRLVSALSTGSSAFFIHIDQKSKLEDFSSIAGDNVHFSSQRFPIYYADYSQVEATLVLLDMALADRHRFDYFVLLSGTDYPLQPVSYVENFFERNEGKSFINMVRMPDDKAGKPISRLRRYNLRLNRNRFVWLCLKIFMRIGLMHKERDYKPYFHGLIPFGGTQWWALPREACEYIQAFVNHELSFMKFYENVRNPSESMFHTIIGNSPFKGIQKCLTFTDWSAGGWHPSYLTEDHLDFFASNPVVTSIDVYGAREVLFARKFSDQRPDLVDRLDEIRKSKEDMFHNTINMLE